MSYCSKCGVELSHTEDACPLCGAQIHTKEDITQRAYPANMEAVPQTSPHIALRGLILLLFPVLCCLTVNLAKDGLVSWALYVAGADACIFTYAFLPKFFARPKASVCILVSSAVTSAYLFLVGHLSGSGEWVVPLGLPLIFLSGSTLFAVTRVLVIKKASKLFKSAVIICSSGFFAMAVEAIIDINRLGLLTLGWALPVFLPVACVTAALLYIEYDGELKNRLHKAVLMALYT